MDTGFHLPCRGIPTERKAGSVRCLCEETTMSELLSHLRHDQIARLAYELWQRNGRPAGSAERDWLLAEQILEVLDPTKPAFGAFSFEANERLRSWRHPMLGRLAAVVRTSQGLAIFGLDPGRFCD